MKKGIDYIGVSVGAMIINEKGEIFLAKRSQKAKNERGAWENPGGGVEFGETLSDALRREIREEYGVDIDIVEQFPVADHLIPAEKQHWAATTFLAKFKNGQIPQIMEPEKCDAIGWFSMDNLPKPVSIITKMDLDTYQKRFPKAPASDVNAMKGFINFVREQGVIGLAVGFILGGSIQKVVTSMVSDILNPFISLLVGSAGNMKDQFIKIGPIKIMWGNFTNTLIDFLVVAAVVYFGVKAIGLDKLDKKKDSK